MPDRIEAAEVTEDAQGVILDPRIDPYLFVVLTITEDGVTYRIKIPRGARMELPIKDGDPRLRVEPDEGFEEFGDDDGLIAIHPENIVEMAAMGTGGLVLLPPDPQ